jgi:predicted NBD/HSP70 family sugar kinase
MYNVAQSAIVERVMQAPKAPWAAPAEAVEGYEKIWQTANTANHSYLPYNHVDDNGNPIPSPTRTQPATVETGLNQIAMGASDDIKSETGQYDASLGQKSNETSGKAIMARQREGDTATYHYVDNLARAVRHVGRIVLDMIPRVYDTQRAARIIGEDGEQSNVTLNPENPQALTEIKDDQGALQRIFNPNIGTYDVYTSTGPSFTTRRVEAVEAMTQMTQANPQLWQVIGDLLVKNMDWPGADDMAKRLKLTLLPQVQEEVNKEQGEPEVPPQIQQVMQQMQEQTQQLEAALNNAAAEVEKLEGELQGKDSKITQEQFKTMRIELDLQRERALGEIKNAQQELQPEQGEDPEVVKLQIAREANESAEKIKLFELAASAMQATNNQPQAESAEVEQPELGPNMQDVLLANMQAIQALAQQIAQPKQASISITKNADGSFTGTKEEY